MCNFEAFKALMEKTRKEFADFLDNEESDPIDLWAVYQGSGNPPWDYERRKVIGFTVDKDKPMLYTLFGETLSLALVYASEEEAQQETARRNQEYEEGEKQRRIEALTESIESTEKIIERNKAWIIKCQAELDDLQKETKK